MYKCSICGKEFDDLNEYVSDVAFCADEERKKQDALKKDALAKDRSRREEELRKAESRYYKLLQEYKKDYGQKRPDPFEIFFGF